MGYPIRRRCQALATLAALACFAATPARADDTPAAVSSEGAHRLEQQVSAWLATMLGPRVTPGDLPLHITAESDHYLLELPFARTLSDATGARIEADPAFAELRPLDRGRWGIDNVRAPSPLHASLPLPGSDDPSDSVSLSATIAHQEQHAVLDPSLATPSYWDTKIQGYASTITGMRDGGSRKTSIDEAFAHLTAEPNPNGRLTVRQTSDTHLLAVNAVMPNVGLISIAIERMEGGMRLQDVAPEQVAPLLHAVMDLLPSSVTAARRGYAHGGSPDTAPLELSDKERAAARDMLIALARLLGGFDEHATLENLHLAGRGYSGHIAKVALGIGASAPHGRSLIHWEMTLDGLDSSDIPPGLLRDYLPHHIAIAPRISGLPSADLQALLLRAIDSPQRRDDQKLARDARALLAKGPLAVGLDDLQLDFGPATLRGNSEVRIRDVGRYEGEAHLAATGLDELIKQANARPDLARAMPVLFMLKGMGKQEGDKTVWNATYHDGRLLVNGNDMSRVLPRNH